MIMAHGDLIHLERLIDELSDENSRLYIHLDQRIVCPNHLLEKPGVFFIPHPYHVYWGGFSTVQATLKLMRFAIDQDFGDYYALISGADYPVKSKADFYHHLEQGKEFINILSPKKSKRYQRYLYYHFEKFDRRSYLHPHSACFHLLELIIKLFSSKRKPDFKIYFGSMWFILSKSCIHHILQEEANNKKYETFFKHTLLSDEAFFHTIIGNSPFIERVVPNLTYTYWPSKLAPGPITSTQIDILKNNTTFTGIYGTFIPFFARKFSDKSTNSIKHIKDNLL